MKILLIHNFYRYYSGEDTYFFSLVKLLKEKRHKVVTFTKNSKDIDDNLLNKTKVSLGMFWNRQVEKELIDIIKREKPDIAQFQNIYPLISPTAYHVCKKFNIPIIQRISNYRFFCPKGTLFRNGSICELCVSKRFFYPSIIYGCYTHSRAASFIFSSSFFFHRLMKSFDLIDTFIFPSKFIKDFYVKNLHIPKEKTTVIPTFVNITNNIKANKVKEKDYFLFSGQLSEEKGIIPLLDLFKTLPNMKLIVIGDGPLRSKVESYKKYKNIIVKGFLPHKEVVAYMKNAISTIVPSLWYDVLPNVILESFSQGTPVIVPKFGSFEELIVDRKNGIFYQKDDAGDLREKLILIFQNKELKKKMSFFARKEYKKKYIKKNHYRKLIGLYNNIIHME